MDNISPIIHTKSSVVINFSNKGNKYIVTNLVR